MSESLFEKVAGLKTYNFNRKGLLRRRFPVNIAKIVKNSSFYITPLMAASVSF